MDNKDFFDIEEQIENSINNALRYIDYANEKATNIRNNIVNDLSNAAEDVVNDVKIKFKSSENSFDKISKKFEDSIDGLNLNRKEKRQINKYISKNPSGKYKGIIYTIIGTTGCIAALLGAGAVSVLSMFTGRLIKLGVNMTLGMLFIIFIISLIVVIKGSKSRKRIERFKKYSNILEGRNFSEISTLAESISKKNRFVIKDLQKMMELKMFNEGHISEDKSYFILSDAIYKEYMDSINSYNKRKEFEEEEAQNDDLSKSQNNELNSVIELGNRYISEIESVNYSLRSNNISMKIDEMLTIIRNIFDNIKNNPSNIPLVKKFLNHYLPITLKLLKSYKELDEQSIEGDNIRKAKAEIEKSIDLINTAFKKLLDDLFQDVFMDVSSDISVLETLFAQEGLTEDDFKKKKKEK